LLRKEKDKKIASLLVFVLAIIAGIFGIYSKQNAAIFPVAFFLMEVLLIPGGKYRNRKFHLLLIANIILLAILFLIIFGLFPEETDLISRKNYLITQSRVLVRYLSLMIIPVGQNLDYDFALSTSLLDTRVVISVLILIFVLLFGVFSYKKDKILTFAVLWFFLSLAIESSLIPIKDVINEHRCYLAMWSYGIFLVITIDFLFRKVSVKYSYILLFLIVIAYSATSMNRNRVWDTNYTLWTDVVKKSPNKPRPWNNLGYATLMMENKPDESIEYFEKAIALDPHYGKAYNNLGMAWKEKGNMEKSSECFRIAVEKLRIPAILNNYGCALILNGQSQEALSFLLEAVREAPGDYNLNYNIGVAYEQTADTANAIKYYNNTLRIAPGYNLAKQKLENLENNYQGY